MYVRWVIKLNLLMMTNRVILVDKENNKIGTEEKIQAHLKSLLHRAFSIFIFNDNKEILLQKRAENKYHSGSLWTNTCCSHPYDGLSTLECAEIRLVEEMGIKTKLEEIFSFIYKESFQNYENMFQENTYVMNVYFTMIGLFIILLLYKIIHNN